MFPWRDDKQNMRLEMETIQELDELLDLRYWTPEDIDKAIDLLTDYRKMLENEPLKWSDLKEMFHKPVWIETTTKKGWNIIASIDNTDMQVIHTAHRGPKLSGFTRDDLGKTWNAYRKEQ